MGGRRRHSRDFDVNYFLQQKWHLSTKKSQTKSSQCSQPYLFAGVVLAVWGWNKTSLAYLVVPPSKWPNVIPQMEVTKKHRNDHLWVQFEATLKNLDYTISVWNHQAVCFQLLVLRLSASVGWTKVPNISSQMTFSWWLWATWTRRHGMNREILVGQYGSLHFMGYENIPIILAVFHPPMYPKQPATQQWIDAWPSHCQQAYHLLYTAKNQSELNGVSSFP